MAARPEALDRPHPRHHQLNRLDENIGALQVQLTAADLEEIEAASAGIKIEGARYPEKLEQMTGR